MRLLACLALSVGWGAVMATLGERSIYAALGAYAVVVIALLLSFDRRHLLDLLKPTLAYIALGVGLGVAMLAATHVIYGWLRAQAPELSAGVRLVYAQAPPALWAVPAVLVIVVAEELLWRGTFLAGQSRASPVSPLLVVVSLLAYALTQLASGSPVIALAAILCGLVWTVERLVLQSLVAPILTHAIWTVGVVFVWPLERLA